MHATHSLARLTATRNILLIYISTDYVFPGTPGDAPYATDAAPGPTNLYGETKRQGEEAMIQVYKDTGIEGRSVVLRVPVLYGHVEEKDAGGKGNAESAVNSLVDKVWEAQNKKIKMDHWARRYPTNTEDVGRVLVGRFCSVPYLFVSGWFLQKLSAPNLSSP
jgi:dTDP-4-dehydrorhamnose reductase